MEVKMENKEIQKEFERLMAQDPEGLLKPEALVKAAESPTHPLHNKFEWDDGEAAYQYRIWQARAVIKSFTIEMPEMNIVVKALTSLDMDRAQGQGYRWTMDVLKRPDLKSQLLSTAYKELERVQAKYQAIEELATVWESIKAAKQVVDAKN